MREEPDEVFVGEMEPEPGNPPGFGTLWMFGNYL